MHPSFMKNQREIIISLLIKYEETDISLEELLNNLELSNQEFGFIKTIIYGTIRYKLRLDYIIKNLSNIRFNKIHKIILNIMRISLYQLIYMEHLPERAVVNEAVKLAKKYGNKGSVGFINGSLRNFIRNKDSFLKVKSKNKNEVLSILHSYPLWLVDTIEECYKEYNIEDVLKKFNEEATFGIRVNSNKITKEDFVSIIERDYDFDFMTNTSSGIIIENPRNIFNTDIYKNGKFYVQSESSQLVSELIFKYIKPKKILDLCSAPGGKITHMYELLDGFGDFYACDISEYKLELIRENTTRLYGNNDIKILKSDATKKNSELINKFDLVILDAPCSALGLIRKIPEIKYNKKPEDIISLSKIQEKMLTNGAMYLKSGGVISYSTCTFTNEENKNVIDKFLQLNNNFKLLEYVKVSPTDFNSDGFTIFIIKRID